jgi:hypothetical protein
MGLLASLLALFLSSSLSAQATTYSYTGAVFTGFENFTPPCATGPCADLPAGSRATGQFTTATPLGNNLSHANIFPQVTSYSFTDGLNSYSNTNLNVRVFAFYVSTDASGNMVLTVGDGISLQLWQTGASPHVVGDRFALLNINPSDSAGVNNNLCAMVGTSPIGTRDVCTLQTSDASISLGFALSAGTWSKALVPLAPIPTLSVLALVLLSLGLAGFACLHLSPKKCGSIVDTDSRRRSVHT